MKKIIDIVCPSSPVLASEILQIEKFLAKNGFVARIFDQEKIISAKKHPSEFALIDKKIRFSNFKKAVESSDSEIIWCARGGYGSFEIIEFLSQMKKPKTKKIFIGFSDITSLNKILIDDWNWQVAVAPMLSQIINKKISSKSVRVVENLVKQKIQKFQYSLQQLVGDNVEISAQITGGCLSVFAASLATKNQINWENKIIFFEDQGENGERIDRYFSQFLTICSEKNKFPQAIILGNFYQSNQFGNVEKKNIDLGIKKLAENIKNKNLPISLFVEKSRCLGHSEKMLPIILGKKIVIKNNQLIQEI
jgi:muramoyltetrapeptide carboxypeptidase